MSDRHRGYIVILENDIKDEYSEEVINAIRMFKGVINVEPIVTNPDSLISEERAKRELRTKIFDILK